MMKIGVLKVKQGMTLVELSIVMLVLSLLLSMMFSVYYATADIAKKSTPATKDQAKGLQTLEMIRMTINNTYFFPKVKRLIFVSRKVLNGDIRQDRLTLASYNAGSESVGAAAIREVSFYIKPKTDSKIQQEGILIRREDVEVDDEPNTGGNHYPLMEHVRSLEFHYSLDGKNWLDEWNSLKTGRIPRLVQIRLTVFTKGGESYNVYETLASPGLYLK